MSKAILVMDMPNKCYDCLFYYETRDEDDDYVSKCRALKDMTIDGFIDKYFDCPLSEVPGKKEENDTDTDCEYYRVQGYNTCIDEIMGVVEK